MIDLTNHNRHSWQRPQARARLINRLKNAALLAIVVICYGIVGAMDYEDAVMMEAATQAQITESTTTE